MKKSPRPTKQEQEAFRKVLYYIYELHTHSRNDYTPYRVLRNKLRWQGNWRKSSVRRIEEERPKVVAARAKIAKAQKSQ